MYGLILALLLFLGLTVSGEKETVWGISAVVIWVCICILSTSASELFKYIAYGAAGLSIGLLIRRYYEDIINRLDILLWFSGANDDDNNEEKLIKNNKKKIVRKQNLNK